MSERKILQENKNILAVFTSQTESKVSIHFEYVVMWMVDIYLYNSPVTTPLFKRPNDHDLIAIEGLTELYPNFSFKELIINPTSDRLGDCVQKYLEEFAFNENITKSIIIDGIEKPL